MRRVSFENALEVQVAGRFYHFPAGSQDLEESVAEFVVTNYHDRGARYGAVPSTLPGEEVLEPVKERAEPWEPPIAPVTTFESDPDSALNRDATVDETERATERADAEAAEERADDVAEDRSRRGKRTR